MYGDFSIGRLISAIVLITMLIIFIVEGIVFLFTHTNEIRSKKKLEPIRYEVTVQNNKIDTIWIYKKP